MKNKQLELFSEKDFEANKTHFKKKGNWILIDIFNRTEDNWENLRKEKYKFVVNILTNNIYNENADECDALRSDCTAHKISVDEYIWLSQLLKEKMMKYNKKRGKLIKIGKSLPKQGKL